MWLALGNASTVAQLAGVDAVGLIAKIRQMARTASQIRSDCGQLASRVDEHAELLSVLRARPAERTLGKLGEVLVEAQLGEVLVDAHDLVVS
ncbi:hypothetical protein HU200_002500 [Digitaria exilis]|uniref:Uncharacterized protein n=1 Tax=Digitaria exilis TaxID=1010633 RepID=A0A835FZE7_9POAL|nr:hypothetical protein HU200_002500 [Digitaria exilis]